MSTRLFIAPAGAGKTAFAIESVRAAARELRAMPLVLLPGMAQEVAFRQRMAVDGVFGVRVSTFGSLYRAILNRANIPITILTDAARHRVLRDELDALYQSGQLIHYGPLHQRPGFSRALGDLIHEFKQGMISPSDLQQAWADYPASSPSLVELTTIYQSYQQRLRDRKWADSEGLGWLAIEALCCEDQLGRDWSVILVDGFDSFNTLQMRTLEVLSQRAESLTITLTGDPSRPRSLAHRRYARTRERLERTLGVHAEPLPRSTCGMSAALCFIESEIFEQTNHSWGGSAPVELLEAPNRVAEAREVLRWCKERIVLDDMQPNEVAVLTRNLELYRPFLIEVANEFGLPIYISSGLPLRSNLLISALLDLLRLVTPSPDGTGPALPRRLVVEAWRSPYFDWSHALRDEMGIPLAVEPGDADLLDDCARQGLVIAGWEQWREALQRLAQERQVSDHEQDERYSLNIEPAQARLLWQKFEAFVRRLTPPAQASYADYVSWLQALIGYDPIEEQEGDPGKDSSLDIMGCIRREPASAPEDLQALAGLADILNSLVWAEDLQGPVSLPFERFLNELEGAIEATSYQASSVLPNQLLAASVFDARGLSFRAVAIMGLAEGEFPAVLHEDPFLRDDARRFLRQRGLSIDPKLDSDEGGYFYEAVTRAREKLLLTRPRLAEDGSLWQPSPYWDELGRLLSIIPQTLSAMHDTPLQRLASLPELLEWWANHGDASCETWFQSRYGGQWEALLAGAQVMNMRMARQPYGEHEGDLQRAASSLALRYNSRYVWSVSAIESYRTCPFSFFVSRVLGLEPRILPQEGFDVAQRGTILHRILELVYAAAQDKRNHEELLGLAPGCAAQVLATAPEHYGFRPTAWWQAICQEMTDLVRRNIEALNTPLVLGQWAPRYFEKHFPSDGVDPLTVRHGGTEIKLRGVIDRIDLDSMGNLRVIDYKSGSKTGYERKALDEGKKLQLPIYALAARDALALGEPVDGFYWHLASAEPSGLRLKDYGIAEAFECAVAYCVEAVESIRAGRFAPQPAENQCPAWCPASKFCWRYRGPAF